MAVTDVTVLSVGEPVPFGTFRNGVPGLAVRNVPVTSATQQRVRATTIGFRDNRVFSGVPYNRLGGLTLNT